MQAGVSHRWGTAGEMCICRGLTRVIAPCGGATQGAHLQRGGVYEVPALVVHVEVVRDGVHVEPDGQRWAQRHKGACAGTVSHWVHPHA